MSEILVLYFSPGGSIAEMANIVAHGVESVNGMQARVRTVARLSTDEATSEGRPSDNEIPERGPMFATNDDLVECSGLIMGCPTHFGNMPAAMKHFIDGTSSLWLSGKLVGKPAAVFSASTSMHGGQESTLLTMMIPWLHHGMLIVGLPYTETELFTTRSGGSPYGATRLTEDNNKLKITEDEHKLSLALGRRVAQTALKLDT